MAKPVKTIKNKILEVKWLPLALAVGLVFIPSSLMIVKLIGVIIALSLFYHSILLDRDSSKRNLIE